MGTMSASTDFRISGVLLSALLYDMVNSPHDLEGLLIGNVYSRYTRKMDDSSDRVVVNVEVGCVIQGFIPVNVVRGKRLYNALGHVDANVLKEVGGEQLENIVGYFKLRRNSQMKPSLRESAVHASLARVLGYPDKADNTREFQDIERDPEPLIQLASESTSSMADLPGNRNRPGLSGRPKKIVPFVFGLFGATIPRDKRPSAPGEYDTRHGATHTYSYALWKQNSSDFERIPLLVTNLIASGQDEYNNFTSSLSGMHGGLDHGMFGAFENAMRKVDPTAMVNGYETMYSDAINAQEEAARSVAESEIELARLEQEVSELRKRKSQRDPTRQRVSTHGKATSLTRDRTPRYEERAEDTILVDFS